MQRPENKLSCWIRVVGGEPQGPGCVHTRLFCGHSGSQTQVLMFVRLKLTLSRVLKLLFKARLLLPVSSLQGFSYASFLLSFPEAPLYGQSVES